MSIFGTIGHVTARVRKAAHRRHAYYDLRRLDAHLLRDIGVNPCTVAQVVATLGVKPKGRTPSLHDCAA
jgi:uncharacterized protein YjiS (DUF1127 family)